MREQTDKESCFGYIRSLQSIHNVARAIGIRESPERAIVNGENVSIIRVGFRRLVGMMHLVHIRRAPDEGTGTIEWTPEPNIGVFQNTVYPRNQPVNDDSRRRQPECPSRDRHKNESPQSFDRMLAE